MRPRVLWIEDSARLELTSILGPVYFDGRYDFTLAEDVTTGTNLLLAQEFEAVIVDMRLPPGHDRVWRALYREMGSHPVQAQLGMKLLNWFLGNDRDIYPGRPPNWATSRRIGVFTVESKEEIGENLKKLRIAIYRQKVIDLPDTILLELIEEILVWAKASG